MANSICYTECVNYEAPHLHDFFDFVVQVSYDGVDVMVVFALLLDLSIFRNNDELCYFKRNTLYIS